MKLAKSVVALCALAMGIVLLYAFIKGDFSGEGAKLLEMPWGIVSLVDVYVGFTFFAGWIVYREKSLARAIAWVVLVMVLGNFVASIYALLALWRCQGDWTRFWMGARAN
jgi:hypothetical protein